MRSGLALLAVGLILSGVAALTYRAFANDMNEQRARLRGQSELIDTKFGQLEYASRGSGPPLLMIHGTGGGFDQGLTFAENLADFQIIAPSRFGYLRSAFPSDPSSENQADAFVELADRLGVGKLTVVGGSAGALSAVQFALRYPERTSALILVVPAANVQGRDPVEMDAAAEYLVRRLTTSDFLFWAATKIAKEQMIGTLLATDPEIVEHADPQEKARAARILREILPVSLRWRGMLNDAELAGNPAQVDFSQIRVPTLVISVADDRFGTAETAREIVAAVPDSKLLLFETGGHIWIGHDQAVWRAVSDFVQRPAAYRGL